MEGKPNTFKKKTIIEILIVAILVVIAIASIVIFLKDRIKSEAIDDENQQEQIDNNSKADDNSKNDSTTNNNQNSDGQNNNNSTEDNNNNNSNNNTNKNNNNNNVTTGTNVNEIGESTVERVEEVEKLVSRDYWDWWKPTTISVEPSVSKIVPDIPDIEVKKVAKTEEGKNLVYAGGKITYTITVKNNSNTDLEKIEVTDKIPEKTTFNSVENDGTIVTSSKDAEKILGVRWIVTIKAGEEVELTFSVIVNEEATGTVINTAIANGKKSNEEKTSIITNSKTCEVLRYNKESNKYETVETAKLGDEIKYTVSVTNTGDVDGMTTISDDIPKGTELKRGSADNAQLSEDHATLIWNDVVVPAGETVAKTFVVIVKDIEKLENKKITNVAKVGGKNTNETETPTAEIDIKKEVTNIIRDKERLDLDSKVQAGDIIEYKITITNSGSVDLVNVNAKDKLKDIEIDEEKLKIGYFKVGEYREIIAYYVVSFDKDIKNNVGKLVHNEVDVSGETIPTDPTREPEKVYDEDDVDTPVEDAPSITISKDAERVKLNGTDEFITLGNIKVRPGDVIEYRIVVTNTGNTELTNIKVTDTLSVEVYNDNGELELKETANKVDEKGNVEIIPALLKIIPSLEVGQDETIMTYYTVKNDDVTEKETTIHNIATAKPKECDEEKAEEDVPVNPNVTISGTKTWYAPKGYNIPDITIRLYQNNETYKVGNTEVTKTLKAGETEYQFTNLPKYKIEDGNCILNNYTVSEDAVTGFDSQKDGKYNFINTIKQQKISISGTKTWDDNNDQDKIRPDTITIKLFADGEEVKNKVPVISTTQDANKWTYVFSDLDKYSKTGEEIKYTVKEEDVDGYEKTIVGYDITNKHIPETITIKGTKTWDDGENKYKKRPDSITVNLLADEKIVDTTTATKDGKWEYQFTNKPKYSNGVKINYTVEEVTITDYVATYTKTTSNNEDIITINIKNKFQQDITGKIVTVEKSELPLDVVFVLDISESMTHKDEGSEKTRIESMVDATNNTIKELMDINEKNRVSVVVFNSNVNRLTNGGLIHYDVLNLKTEKYITYDTTNSTEDINGTIRFKNGNTINVYTSHYRTGAINCGTYTQGGIKEATKIFKESDKTDGIARKPVMILLTDGDPTHYDTETVYNKTGTKYPVNGEGIAKLRYITAEYYAYTLKTMQNCKDAITGFYHKADSIENKCEIYTVGINMEGAMAKVLLESNKENIKNLEDVTKDNISKDIHNHGEHGEKTEFSVLDDDKNFLKDYDYYHYQANRLYNLLTTGTIKITSDYITNKAYTNSTSDKISENFNEIVNNTITKTTTINITSDSYDSDRIISLDGFNPANAEKDNIFLLKIVQDNGTTNGKTIINTTKVAGTEDYIVGNSTDGYKLVLTNLSGKVRVELKYHK